MKNNDPHKTKKYNRGNGQPNSRNPEHQNFDRLDTFNEFSNLRIINRYRELGNEIMNRNFWK